MKKIFLSLFFAPVLLLAGPGDTTHVISHNAVTVVTNPNTGSNGYKKWAVFPATSLPVRKITATLSYKCAPGMPCGAWDYLDYVYIRRIGGQAQPSKDIEAVRFITPYGNQFNSTWNFNWHMDVTDYAMFLRDSVEIEYIHTGYEGTNVGWQVTLDFSFIEGTPVANPLAFTQLWNGSFPYGNSANSIENYLTPDTVLFDANTSYSKLRMLHTGHGSDANYCSEFCSKNRTLFIDGNSINTRARWKPCGNLALYPQGGTWVYDRAAWCPGDMVQPDVTYSKNLAPGTTHIFDVDMQTYTVSSPSANEVINAQLFEFGTPNNTLDASIEEVYEPSSMKEYNRLNPICRNPQILLRNNGSTPITTADIKFGLKGTTFQSYTWSGNLNHMDSATVTLPNLVIPSTTTVNSIFEVYIDKINGVADQYNYDDSARIKMTSLPPVYDTVFMVVFRTNNYLEDSYYVTDANGNVVHSRLASNLVPNTTYYDTLHLAPGCYDISIYDTGGDGLSWWANTAQGTGFYRLKRLYTPNMIYLKTFNLDFGNFIKFNFYAVPGTFVGMEESAETQKAAMELYPNPATNRVSIEYYCPGTSAPVIEVYDGLGRLYFSEKTSTLNGVYELNINNLSSGVYWIKLVGEQGAITKKVIKE